MDGLMGKDSWKRTSLGAIAALLGGGTPKRSDASNFGNYIDWVTPSDLAPIGEVKPLSKVKEGLSEKGLSTSSAKLMPSGSVLFSSRASIGKIAVADREFCTNQGFVNFIPNKNKVDAWFLAFLLRYHTNDILKLAGETTYKEIGRKKLNPFPIQIPPLKEQRRIVDRIRELLKRVEEIHSLRARSRKEAKSIFLSAAREKYQSLIECNETVPLKNIVKAIGGGTPSKKNTEFWTGNIPWISPKDMKVREICNARDHITEDALAKSSAKLINPPAVLFVVRGMILAHSLPIAVSRVPLAINQDMKALIPKRGYLPEFISFMMSGGSNDLLNKVEIAGHGTRRLKTEIWRELPIPQLSEKEQKLVCENLSMIVQFADKLNGILLSEEEEMLRTSILRKAFAGTL
jgi:type I restriction enzyme, S subunit